MCPISSKTVLTVVLAMAGATTARATQAQDLTNAGTELTVQPGAVLAVPGALLNQAGATLGTGGTVLVGGDFTNAGTVVPGGGQVVFIGTADQTLRPGGATLANLEVRNTGSAGQNRVLLPADLTVTGQLLLTSGLLRTALSATVVLPNGATLAGEASGRYVQGHLRVERSAVSGSTALDFGNGFSLNPNGQALGTVRATRTAGLQTVNVSYGQNPANASQKGIDRIWTVAADQPPATPVGLTLAWLPDDDNGLTFGQGQVWQMPANSAAWQAVGAPAGGAARRLTVSTTGLARLTVSSLSAPLPVELVAFTAERQGPDALLRWATATERNNDRFEVESSPDGRTFRRIGSVTGRGSTSQRHEYSLTDANLARYATDLVYYRLRQIDLDGTAQYSPVRTVRVAGLAARLMAEAFPTPFVTDVALRIRAPEAGLAVIDLYDMVGRCVLQQAALLSAGPNTVPLPAATALPVGSYTLRVVQGRQVATGKLLRQ